MGQPEDQVQARVDLLKRVGLLLKDVDDRAIAKLLRKCPDVDLAATAVQLFPRPRWVAKLIGEAPDLVGQAQSSLPRAAS